MEISSAPYLIDPVDFGLKDLDKNKEKLKIIRGYKQKPSQEYQDQIIEEYAKSPTETFFIATYDHGDGELIGYLAHVKKEKLKALPVDSCYQAAVWRVRGSAMPAGITRYVFLNILMKRYDYVISDQSQSKDGKDFWLDRLGEASRAGHRVGVMVDDIIDWKDESLTYNMWIRIIENTAWGQEDIHFDTRMIIECK